MTDLSLDGVRVLDLTRLMPFAYGTQLLADAGAEVVKVEAHGGEYGRGMPAAFRLTNRGKRSVELDLRDGAAVETLLDLAPGFDVLVESFRPGLLGGIGLGYDAMAAANPRLVYCSGTGFAADGPHARRPGHDLNYAALAGLVSVNGGDPAFPNTPYIDMVAGWGLFASVLLGLVERTRTGRGSRRSVSMTDLALSLNVLGIGSLNGLHHDDHNARGALDGYPWPDLMESGTPCYGTVVTSDGRHLSIANVEPKFWDAFLRVIDRLDLLPYRFATGEESARVRREIQSTIEREPRDVWMTRFDEADVCVADVLTPAEAVECAEYANRGVVHHVDGEVVVSSPLSRGPRLPQANQVPEPGQHSEIYLSLLRRNRDGRR